MSEKSAKSEKSANICDECPFAGEICRVCDEYDT